MPDEKGISGMKTTRRHFLSGMTGAAVGIPPFRHLAVMPTWRFRKRQKRLTTHRLFSPQRQLTEPSESRLFICRDLGWESNRSVIAFH
jgi:hypothetical protein